MAVSKDHVKKLAELSRIELTETELEKMQEDIENILAYVDVVQKIELSDSDNQSPHLDVVNVFREDEDPYEADAFTDELLAQAPSRDGRFVTVKKILG